MNTQPVARNFVLTTQVNLDDNTSLFDYVNIGAGIRTIHYNQQGHEFGVMLYRTAPKGISEVGISNTFFFNNPARDSLVADNLVAVGLYARYWKAISTQTSLYGSILGGYYFYARTRHFVTELDPITLTPKFGSQTFMFFDNGQAPKSVKKWNMSVCLGIEYQLTNRVAFGAEIRQALTDLSTQKGYKTHSSKSVFATFFF